MAMIYALNGRGKVHLAQGQVQAAAPLLNRAIQLLPTLDEADPLLLAEVWWGQAQVLGLAKKNRLEANLCQTLQLAPTELPPLPGRVEYVARGRVN